MVLPENWFEIERESIMCKYDKQISGIRNRLLVGIAGLILSAVVLTGCSAMQEAFGRKQEAEYCFQCVDEAQNAVEGAMIQVSSAKTGAIGGSGKDGCYRFTGSPQVYEVHILEYPENLELVSDDVFRTGDDGGTYEVRFCHSEKLTEKNIDGSDPAEVQKNTAEQIDAEKKGSLNHVPQFTTVDLDGNIVTDAIFSEYDLTVVNVWGTYCGPCIGEMPELGAWAKELPDNVHLMGFVVDIYTKKEEAQIAKAKKILSDAGAEFPCMILDEQANWLDYMLTIQAVPTTFFVDSEGNIVGDPIIGANVDAYKSFVSEYLKKVTES